MKQIMVFVDGHNFLGLLRDYEQEQGKKISNRVNYLQLAKRLVLRITGEYAGTYYYTSTPPGRVVITREQKENLQLQKSIIEGLKLQEGFTVTSLERRYREVHCEKCKYIKKTSREKGIDVHLTTDMLSLAWEDAYDSAILISSDRDYGPALDYLRTKGKRIYNLAFKTISKSQLLLKHCYHHIWFEDIEDSVLV